MPRILGMLILLPLTFALMPLAVLVMGREATAPQTTLVLEPVGEAGAGAALVVPFDAHEFGEGPEALAYRASDGGSLALDACSEVPQG